MLIDWVIQLIGLLLAWAGVFWMPTWLMKIYDKLGGRSHKPKENNVELRGASSP